MIVYQGNLGDDVSFRFFILLLLLRPCSIHSLFRLFFDDTFSVLTTQISCLNQFLFVFCFVFGVVYLECTSYHYIVTYPKNWNAYSRGTNCRGFDRVGLLVKSSKGGLFLAATLKKIEHNKVKWAVKFFQTWNLTLTHTLQT